MHMIDRVVRAHEQRRAAVHAALSPTASPTGSLVLDIAWDRPTVAEITGTGAVGVMRYFSPDTTKNLTPAEVSSYGLAGLSTGTVFESTTGRATQGRAAGYADAQLAEQQRKQCGLPNDHIHHFAVDSDLAWSAVQAYFDGAADLIGLSRVGTYGGIRVINGAYGHGIRYLWQTTAWSSGQLSPHATLYQNGGTALNGAADTNRVLSPDWGQYPRPENDMALTTADADVLINQMNVRRDELVFATAYWLHRAADPSITIPTGPGLPPVVGEIAAFRAFLASQRTAEAAQIQQIIADLSALSDLLTGLESPTALQVQTGMNAALRQLGAVMVNIPAP